MRRRGRAGRYLPVLNPPRYDQVVSKPKCVGKPDVNTFRMSRLMIVFPGVLFGAKPVCRREPRRGQDGIQGMYPSLFLFRCFGRISGLWWVNRVFFCTLKKKNPLKTKVSKVLRRASTNSSVPEGKHQEAKVSADAGAPLNLPWTNMAALMLL